MDVVANGSRYIAEILHWAADAEPEDVESVILDVGEIYPFPRLAIRCTINLRLNPNSTSNVAKNISVNFTRTGRSIIITEEGCIVDIPVRVDKDYPWRLGPLQTDLRPKKFFVANATGKVIEVQRLLRSGTSVRVEHGETNSFEYEDIAVTFTDSMQHIFEGSVKPRTSLVVCSKYTAKATGKLYGDDIEDKKWIVDGKNYKPEIVAGNAHM